jgi:hypothetical protein
MDKEKTHILLSIYLILCIVIIYPLNAWCQTAQEKEAYDIILSEESGNLTLEAVIGNNTKLDNKYLLANPSWIKVKNGDICVSDEYFIKVFNPDGTGKAILGGRGQGPGEFESRFVLFTVSPAGFIAASPSSWDRFTQNNLPPYITIFTPNYKLVSKKRHSMDDILFCMKDYVPGKDSFSIQRIYALNEYELMNFIEIIKKDIGKFIYYVICENNKDKTVTAVFRDERQLKYPEFPVPFQGSYYFDLTDNNSIIYMHPAEVTYVSDEMGIFTVGIYSIKDKKTEKLRASFKPYIRPKESIDSSIKFYNEVKDKNSFRKAFNETRYSYPLTSYIYSDNKYYYITIRNFEDKKYNYLMYIFDKNEQILVKRVLTPYSELLNNGKLYLLSKDKEGYPAIFVYKVNPAVWENK